MTEEGDEERRRKGKTNANGGGAREEEEAEKGKEKKSEGVGSELKITKEDRRRRIPCPHRRKGFFCTDLPDEDPIPKSLSTFIYSNHRCSSPPPPNISFCYPFYSIRGYIRLV